MAGSVLELEIENVVRGRSREVKRRLGLGLWVFHQCAISAIVMILTSSPLQFLRPAPNVDSGYAACARSWQYAQTYSPHWGQRYPENRLTGKLEDCSKQPMASQLNLRLTHTIVIIDDIIFKFSQYSAAIVLPDACARENSPTMPPTRGTGPMMAIHIHCYTASLLSPGERRAGLVEMNQK